MPACCAPGCRNRSEKDRKFGRKTLFSLPTGPQDSKKREIWLRMINRRDIGSIKHLRLCEDHFAPDQYERHRADGLKKLRHDAVPSIFFRGHHEGEESESNEISRDIHRVESRLLGQSPSLFGHVEIPIQADVGAVSDVLDYDYAGLAVDPSCEKENLIDALPGEMPTIGQCNQCNCSDPMKQLEHSYSQLDAPDRLEESSVPVSRLLAPVEISVQPVTEGFSVFIADSHLAGLSAFLSSEKDPLEDNASPRKLLVSESKARPSKQVKRDDHCYSKDNSLIVEDDDPEQTPTDMDGADAAAASEPIVEVFADSTNGRMKDASYEAARLKRLLISEQKRRRRAEEKLRRVKDSVKDVLAEDQLEMLVKGTMRGSCWSEATMNKALKLRTVCGSRGYHYLKNNCFPLPSERTLQKHVRAKFVKDVG